MSTINSQFRDRSVHSIRINDKLVDICKDTGLPLSQIVENCLTNFATMSDDDRIQFLVEADPDKVESSRLKTPSYNFAEKAIEKAKQHLGDKPTERTSNKLLIAIGLVLLAAVLLLSNKEKV